MNNRDSREKEKVLGKRCDLTEGGPHGVGTSQKGELTEGGTSPRVLAAKWHFGLRQHGQGLGFGGGRVSAPGDSLQGEQGRMEGDPRREEVFSQHQPVSLHGREARLTVHPRGQGLAWRPGSPRSGQRRACVGVTQGFTVVGDARHRCL